MSFPCPNVVPTSTPSFTNETLSLSSFNSTYNFYLPDTDLVLYQVCTERWSDPMHKFLYTLLLMFVQYFIPIGTIMVTHTKIIKIVQVRRKAGNTVF